MANRIVSKQECMVEISELPLTQCSEITETINISGSYKVSSESHSDMVSRYRKIAKSRPDLSLYEFVNDAINARPRKIVRKYSNNATVIPHFVGARGQPKHPPTKEYAMSTLIVHKPWGDEKPKTRESNQAWIDEFLEFIQQSNCPETVKLEYARIKERSESKRQPEATTAEECFDNETTADTDDTVKDLLNIITTQTMSNDPFLNINEKKINRGLTYNWSQRTTVSKKKIMLGQRPDHRNHNSPALNQNLIFKFLYNSRKLKIRPGIQT
jgi:hypothetical protein